MAHRSPALRRFLLPASVAAATVLAFCAWRLLRPENAPSSEHLGTEADGEHRFRTAVQRALRSDPVTPPLDSGQSASFAELCGQLLEAYTQPTWDGYVLLMQSMGGRLKKPDMAERLGKQWGPKGLSFPWTKIHVKSIRIEAIQRMDDGAVLTPGSRDRPIHHMECKFDFGVDLATLGKEASRAVRFTATDQRGFEHNVWLVLGWDSLNGRWVPLWMWADDPAGEWMSPVVF